MKTSYWRKFIEELIEKKYKTKEEYAEGLMDEIKRMLEIIESADFAIEELSTRNIRLVEENKELKEELEKLEEEIAMIEEDNRISKERIILKDNRIRILTKERQEIKELLLNSYETTSDRNEIIDKLKEENKELEKIIDRIIKENHVIIDGIANGECCQYKALYEKQKQENEELKEDNLRLSEIEDRYQFLIEELTEFKTQLLFLLENKDKSEEV